MLVFYPFAFSRVCTDQLNLYEEVLDELEARGATLYGVSCDATYSQTAFREKLGVTHRAAVGLRAQGRGRAEPSASTTRAAFRSARWSSSDPTAIVKWSYQADVARSSCRGPT